MIVIATYATKRYSYALPNFSRRISSAITNCKEAKNHDIVFIFVSDKSKEIESSIEKYLEPSLPAEVEINHIQLDITDDDLKNYKEDAQLMIAQMQSAAMTEARRIGADYFWSVESDVLVPPNSLTVSLDTLHFDNSYYDVAMITYPSQGGGSFLGGRGDYRHAIAEDFLPEERDVPEEVMKRSKEREEEFAKRDFKPDQKWYDEGREIHEKIKKCPPKKDIWKTIGEHGWRKRGWMEYAYPALGKGAILPTDWVGMGCTMLSSKALHLAHFDGYHGAGTQDLYLCWHWWNPNDLKMAVVSHTVADHVVRARGDSSKGESQNFNKIIHVRAYHEPEGEYAGHLRQQHLPFYKFIEGERYEKENDGAIYMHPKTDTEPEEKKRAKSKREQKK